MPKKLREDLLDDIAYGTTGQEVEATEERTFTVGGQQFHTYLSAENAKRFDEDMRTWTEFAEKVPSSAKARKQSHGGGGGNVATPRRDDSARSARVRAWAKEQNWKPEVSDRGRIPAKVNDAYDAAHPGQGTS